MMTKKNIFFLIAILIGVTIIYFIASYKSYSDYYDPLPIATHSSGDYYVGSQTCMECHAEIYQSHIMTAHYLSSSRADSSSIKGNLKTGENGYSLNDSMDVRITASKAGIFQEVYDNVKEEIRDKSKIDVVIGSGTKGQSYLHWEGEELYQLHASYYAPSDSWTNSPGLVYSKAAKRPVNAKCMECHTTFSKSTTLYGMGNSYDRQQIVYGIDCERCHGPSKKHVDYHRKNKEATASKFIIRYDTLSQQQHLDACALCHSGVRIDTKPAFIFKAGDRLKDFSLPGKTKRDSTQIDVHGNQYALLLASACFKKSNNLNCTSCHDPHVNQRGNATYFNQKCLECHGTELKTCSLHSSERQKKSNDCIACHMPLTPSSSMFIKTQNDSIEQAVLVRTHLIDIYRSELEKTQKKNK